jgi:hypothetical protein
MASFRRPRGPQKPMTVVISPCSLKQKRVPPGYAEPASGCTGDVKLGAFVQSTPCVWMYAPLSIPSAFSR